nr:hypothetical protein Iba_chr02eCG6060 [Ipomoea batatas]
MNIFSPTVRENATVGLLFVLIHFLLKSVTGDLVIGSHDQLLATERATLSHSIRCCFLRHHHSSRCPTLSRYTNSLPFPLCIITTSSMECVADGLFIDSMMLLMHNGETFGGTYQFSLWFLESLLY